MKMNENEHYEKILIKKFGKIKKIKENKGTTFCLNAMKIILGNRNCLFLSLSNL
jgi:hypothetical protein